MTELEDALIGLVEMTRLAEEIHELWDPWLGDTLQDAGREAARLLHERYPDSSAQSLLKVSIASGVPVTPDELEGWEQYWLELGLDNASEVEQTAPSDGWHQPPLPGLEEM